MEIEDESEKKWNSNKKDEDKNGNVDMVVEEEI